MPLRCWIRSLVSALTPLPNSRSVIFTFLRGDLGPEDVDRIARELLVDPVVEGFRAHQIASTPLNPSDEGMTPSGDASVIEVGFHPGVTDPVAAHVLRRARMLGTADLEAVTTGKRYQLAPYLADTNLHRIAREVLCNEVIQSYTLGHMAPAFVPDAAPSDAVDSIPIRDLDDGALARLSVARVLFLSLPEMQAIQKAFRAMDRDPTDVELESGQTWSEHCLHKTFKAKEIAYRCEGGMDHACVRDLVSRSRRPSRA